MTSPVLTAEQRTARDAIARVCASGLPTLELLEQVARRVRAVVPYASGGWLSEDAPGMIIVRDDDSIESMTDAGRHWLSEMRLDVGADLDLPSMVYQLVRRARIRDSVLARGRVRLPSGCWLFVHAARLSNPEGGAAARTVVLLEPARRAQLAELIVELYGLTEREREVTELLVRGLAVREIAAALSISPYTVRDHVKAIFAKTGVASRPELTAKFFYEHFGMVH